MKKTDETNVDVKEESKGKQFYKKHRKAIRGIIAGITVGVAACMIKNHLNTDSKDNSENEESDEESDEEVELTDKQKDIRKIDEQIFTQLAPDIESFVLDEDLDYVEHEETYTYGDIIKDVFVSITTRKN